MRDIKRIMAQQRAEMELTDALLGLEGKYMLTDCEVLSILNTAMASKINTMNREQENPNEQREDGSRFRPR